MENGARRGIGWGVTSFSRIGYHGPLSPPGPPQRYRFTLSALDRSLDLPVGASAPEVLRAMGGPCAGDRHPHKGSRAGMGRVACQGGGAESVDPERRGRRRRSWWS
ncbi:MULTISPECIES: hypothetical protein [unclassified Cyanobium]|uniref:hypothetical protein n=1 Tax=unclassified Cyanobium TaxID=2627006 RepID=UPI0037BE9085